MANLSVTHIDRFGNKLRIWVSARDALNATADDLPDSDYDLPTAALYHAEDSLIATPSETISDFRAKMEIVFSDPNAAPRQQTITALFADLIRLTKEPSRTFNPETWLKYFELRGGMWANTSGKPVLLIPSQPGEALGDLMAELERFDGEAAVLALIEQRQPRAA